jgi:lipoprotein-anchoring transpeptidase ErfK/SrfK
LGDLVVASQEPPTTKYTITAEDAAAPTVRSIPRDMMAKARLKRLNYTSMLEMLAEKFHASPALPEATESAAAARPRPADRRAERERGGSRRGKPQPDVVIHVSKSSSTLWVTDAAGKTIMHAPVTSGSEHDPLPIGEWTVTAVSRNPTFNYNPDLFWDADPSHAKAKIPPGPNNPVGVVWIDISKAALRHSRHARAVDDRPHGVARLRAPDQLGRAASGGDGRQGHQGGVRGVRGAAMTRPAAGWLIGAAGIGFLAGALVMALPRPRCRR